MYAKKWKLSAILTGMWTQILENYESVSRFNDWIYIFSFGK